MKGDDEEARPPVELEIGDTLDLHSFQPRDVPSVVRDYLDLAYEKGLFELRIIHGRGIGVQRRTVRTLLARDPRVTGFGDADPAGGGWGATWVRLTQRQTRRRENP
ncbi:MAG TPA: Smr/MutS family protein [Thermoanaerobaculia bacterium]|nr:Smr/MutS family protein [Thermoanaerobaculia bacterium]